jgi:hypothetical protein
MWDSFLGGLRAKGHHFPLFFLFFWVLLGARRGIRDQKRPEILGNGTDNRHTNTVAELFIGLNIADGDFKCIGKTL